ncbi:MAG: sulfatase/phosphatase domain-containing protein, partial [Acidimicrobiales bacterium]
EGGIRDPLIVHWPNGITDGGGLRDQYHHVSDVLPTILDCAGIDPPTDYKGVTQQPVEGSSFRYSFDAPDAPTTKTTQYYEMVGHRAIWHEGWKAVTMHRRGAPFDEDRWSLFHTDEDFSECFDVADEHPEKLRELVDRWWVEAGRYNVLPLDDRGAAELFVIRRPGHQPPGPIQRFLPASPHLERSKTPDLRNRSFEIRARVTRGGDGAAGAEDGVLAACGARTGGYTFFVQNDRLWFIYNYLGTMYEITADSPLPAGDVELAVRYTKSAEHEGTAELLVRSGGLETSLGSGSIKTLPYRQTTYGMDIGCDAGPTISPRYEGPFPYQGTLHDVCYELQDDRDDLIRAAEVELANQLADQ